MILQFNLIFSLIVYFIEVRGTNISTNKPNVAFLLDKTLSMLEWCQPVHMAVEEIVNELSITYGTLKTFPFPISYRYSKYICVIAIGIKTNNFSMFFLNFSTK